MNYNRKFHAVSVEGIAGKMGAFVNVSIANRLPAFTGTGTRRTQGLHKEHDVVLCAVILVGYDPGSDLGYKAVLIPQLGASQDELNQQAQRAVRA